jgi:hypothetical protein
MVISYMRELFADPLHIQCFDGAFVTRVANKGTYATFGE